MTRRITMVALGTALTFTVAAPSFAAQGDNHRAVHHGVTHRARPFAPAVAPYGAPHSGYSDAAPPDDYGWGNISGSIGGIGR